MKNIFYTWLLTALRHVANFIICGCAGADGMMLATELLAEPTATALLSPTSLAFVSIIPGFVGGHGL